ncbi:hypothetical protein DAI22_04g020300 [Oryza sativa Japonica Group]|nr:hypothetical protein DAI22_04g020300 [Oryza sativa Japonica Group]
MERSESMDRTCELAAASNSKNLKTSEHIRITAAGADQSNNVVVTFFDVNSADSKERGGVTTMDSKR